VHGRYAAPSIAFDEGEGMGSAEAALQEARPIEEWLVAAFKGKNLGLRN
jgi:hypothetical protein